MPTLPDAPRPALPDLQHCKASDWLCLEMGTGFTAGKQPGVPRAWGRECASPASQVMLPSILLQLRVSQQAESCRGARAGLPLGSAAAGAGAGTAAQDLRHRCSLWQGAEEVLQQH